MTLVCNLTTPEFRLRKQTIVAAVKARIVSAVETSEGFLYSFDGNDETIALVLRFVATERQCCDFFHYRLALDSATQRLSLELGGPEGVKEFIRKELEM